MEHELTWICFIIVLVPDPRSPQSKSLVVCLFILESSRLTFSSSFFRSFSSDTVYRPLVPGEKELEQE